MRCSTIELRQHTNTRNLHLCFTVQKSDTMHDPANCQVPNYITSKIFASPRCFFECFLWITNVGLWISRRKIVNPCVYTGYKFLKKTRLLPLHANTVGRVLDDVAGGGNCVSQLVCTLKVLVFSSVLAILDHLQNLLGDIVDRLGYATVE
jgi:hypothetical protein